MKLSLKLYLPIFSLLSLAACKKFVEVPLPKDELVGAAVYNSNASAAAAVNGIYSTMAGNSVGGGRDGISGLMGLSADEFTLYPNPSDAVLPFVYTNSILSTNGSQVPPIWLDLYNCIYQANSAIEGISASTGVTPSMKQQLLGEAEFLRAFCYFYLVNVYGAVPLTTTTNYQTNEILARTPVPQVYAQIVADLKDAQNKLSDNFLAPDGTTTTERVRPNKGAATALLARVYLYLGDLNHDQTAYVDAETQSTAVITDANYQLLGNLNNVFLANSNEAIWQLEPPNTGGNTLDGGIFLLPDIGGPSFFSPYILSNRLENSFEANDLRKTNWTDSILVSNTTYYFPYKYKLNVTGAPPVEYTMVLRLAEQYLIRAEARAEQGNISGGLTDLNVIRNRAGLPNSTAATQADLLADILKELRVELFTEYGHRWLDLKRSGQIDAVMSVVTPQKGGTWKTTAQLFPIPFHEIQADHNLVQNPGYN